MLGLANIVYIVLMSLLLQKIKSNKNNCLRLGPFCFLLLLQPNSGSELVSVNHLIKEWVTRKIHNGWWVFHVSPTSLLDFTTSVIFFSPKHRVFKNNTLKSLLCSHNINLFLKIWTSFTDSKPKPEDEPGCRVLIECCILTTRKCPFQTWRCVFSFGFWCNFLFR